MCPRNPYAPAATRKNMQKHTKNYMNHYGYVCQEEIMCEICGSPAVDIHHKTKKSICAKRGIKDKDHIDNLIALCRECHDVAHGLREIRI